MQYRPKTSSRRRLRVSPLISRNEMWTDSKLPRNPRRVISQGESWHSRVVGGFVGATTTAAPLRVQDVCAAFIALTGTNFKIRSLSIWSAASVELMNISFVRTALTNDATSSNPDLAVSDVGTNQDLAKVRLMIPAQKQKLISYSSTDTTILVNNLLAGGRLYWRANLKFQS